MPPKWAKEVDGYDFDNDRQYFIVFRTHEECSYEYFAPLPDCFTFRPGRAQRFSAAEAFDRLWSANGRLVAVLVPKDADTRWSIKP